VSRLSRSARLCSGPTVFTSQQARRLCFVHVDHTHASPTVRLLVVSYDVFLLWYRVHSRAVCMLCAMSPLRVVVRAIALGCAVRQSVACLAPVKGRNIPNRINLLYVILCALNMNNHIIADDKDYYVNNVFIYNLNINIKRYENTI